MSIPRKVRCDLEKEGLLPASPDADAVHPFLHPHPTTEGAALREIVEWIQRGEANGDGAVAKWLDFLRSMTRAFEEVNQRLGDWNEASSHSLGHDKWSVGWAGSAFLPLANALYVLKDYGIEGRILECGVFKGSSTVCLSLVCRELDLFLDCADSFEGLPEGEGHYGRGDFLGTLEEVRKNVERFGCLDRVNFIKGWYSESLADYRDPLSLLWIDVDLQESTLDVLRAVGPVLNRSGVIFSDGFSEGVDVSGDRVVRTGGEPAGFARWFAEANQDYTAALAGAKGLASIALRSDPSMRFVVPPGFAVDLVA